MGYLEAVVAISSASDDCFKSLFLSSFIKVFSDIKERRSILFIITNLAKDRKLFARGLV